MEGLDLPEGVGSEVVATPRLATHVLTSGPEDGIPVLFLHGNASSSRFFGETLAALASLSRYRGLAPDLRGFGDSESKPLDATRGLGDFSDDMHDLALALGLEEFHLVGWSAGGSVAMRYTMDHPQVVASLVLVDPMSPYGFGGTKDIAGTPCWQDHAGSGGGTANPEFVGRLEAKDRTEGDPNSPRNVMNYFYFKPPFRAATEEVLLSSVLSTQTGEENYPGDMTVSENWPGVAPGERGMNNAISPKYCNLEDFALVVPGPPVLWVRGDEDAIVSDTSLLDFGFLGQLDAIPGWPGAEVFPPQPMVSQTRAVLDAYEARGGRYREEVIPDCGHTPHVEKPEEFQRLLLGFLNEHDTSV
ncbi:MAG: alpha/beta hydrolase [Rubrobacteraceae bacterium]|nr:alpha/beta hydrolase [Rubrobacteraceae bacterium]